jgi:hypothetical protein
VHKPGELASKCADELRNYVWLPERRDVASISMSFYSCLRWGLVTKTNYFRTPWKSSSQISCVFTMYVTVVYSCADNALTTPHLATPASREFTSKRSLVMLEDSKHGADDRVSVEDLVVNRCPGTTLRASLALLSLTASSRAIGLRCVTRWVPRCYTCWTRWRPPSSEISMFTA